MIKITSNGAGAEVDMKGNHVDLLDELLHVFVSVYGKLLETIQMGSVRNSFAQATLLALADMIDDKNKQLGVELAPASAKGAEAHD